MEIAQLLATYGEKAKVVWTCDVTKCEYETIRVAMETSGIKDELYFVQ